MDLLHSLKTVLLLILLPPGGPIWLGLLGAALLRRHHRLGLRLLVVAVMMAYVTSIPLTADLLSRLQQPYPALELEQLQTVDARAIVVLAGGLNLHAPEWPGGQTVHSRTLGRTRYAAYLARHTGLPVLAAGGYRHREGPAEGALMGRLLREEFGIGQVLVEQTSQDTWQNAVNAATLLRDRQWHRVILVTHAIHMPRAVEIFERVGLEVIPAPTQFFDDIPNPLDLYSWLPQAGDLQRNNYLLYEGLGRLWYRWRPAPELVVPVDPD